MIRGYNVMVITHSIVNEKMMLVGFVIEGTEKEFGGLTDSKVTRPVQSSRLVGTGFSNSQIDTRSGKIKCRGNFQLKDLGVKMLSGDSFVDISNRIRLKKRLLYNGILKGFEVERGDGAVMNYSYEGVVRLAKLFKTDNFSIRTSTSGKSYIAGVGGSINELPEIEMGRGKDTSLRRRSGVRSSQVEKDSSALADADLISLYELVASVDGMVVRMPDDIYKSRSEYKTRHDDSFKSLGFGEVGLPRLDFGEKKLNASTTFKNLGTINIEVDGNVSSVYTYTLSTKTIFAGTGNYMQKFLVGVTTNAVKQIERIYGNNLLVRSISDENLIKTLRLITGKGLMYYEVDTTHLNLMSDKRAEGMAKLPLSEVGKLVRQLAVLKARVKVLKDIANEAKDLGMLNDTDIKDVSQLFSGYNESYLKAIMEAGVDVTSGAFTKQVKAIKNAEYTDSSKREKPAKADIEIELAIKGLDTKKLTLRNLKDVLDNNAKAESKMIKIGKLDELAHSLYAERDLGVRAKKALELKAIDEKRAMDIVRQLWLWKIAMVMVGNGSILDKGKVWDSVATRAKNSTMYVCKDVDGLVMKLTNISLEQ